MRKGFRQQLSQVWASEPEQGVEGIPLEEWPGVGGWRHSRWRASLRKGPPGRDAKNHAGGGGLSAGVGEAGPGCHSPSGARRTSTQGRGWLWSCEMGCIQGD